jgi:hypothetical protein
LIFKKRFRADFKKIILNNSQDNLEKIAYFNDEYKDTFDEIEDLLNNIDL